jgi:hypothetical protein
MRKFIFGSVLVAAGCLPFNSLPAAAQPSNNCRQITDVKKRMDCIEDRLDKAAQPALPTAVAIKSHSRGLCLNWIDNAAAPTTISCNHGDQAWDLVPASPQQQGPTKKRPRRSK